MALVDLRTKNKKKGTTKWEGKNSTWVSGRTNKIIAPRSGTKQKVGDPNPNTKKNRKSLLGSLKNRVTSAPERWKRRFTTGKW